MANFRMWMSKIWAIYSYQNLKDFEVSWGCVKKWSGHGPLSRPYKHNMKQTNKQRQTKMLLLLTVVLFYCVFVFVLLLLFCLFLFCLIYFVLFLVFWSMVFIFFIKYANNSSHKSPWAWDLAISVKSIGVFYPNILNYNK